MKKLTLLSLVFLLIDIVVKVLVNVNLSLGSSISIIPNFFDITYVRNTGAAFSILAGSRMLFIVIAIAALYLIYHFLIQNKVLNRFDTVTYSLLIGGIIGNLLDRIIYGYVIDYLSFTIFNYNFPIFNLADTFIVISVILIFIKELRCELCKK